MSTKKERDAAEDDIFEEDLGEFSDEDDDGDATQLKSKEFELPDGLPQVHWHRRTVADIVGMYIELKGLQKCCCVLNGGQLLST